MEKKNQLSGPLIDSDLKDTSAQRTEIVHSLDKDLMSLMRLAGRAEAFDQMSEFIFKAEELTRLRTRAAKGRSKDRSSVISDIDAQLAEIKAEMLHLAYRHRPLGVVKKW